MDQNKSSEFPAEVLGLQLFKVLQENKSLRLELEHERKQRAMEQRTINQILQSVSQSEAELELSGRTVQSLTGVVSNLIKSSCSHTSPNIYIQSLGKKIVSVYQNQLKNMAAREVTPTTDSTGDPSRIPCENASQHISYSLFGDRRMTSAELDAVPELSEGEDSESSSDEEASLVFCSRLEEGGDSLTACDEEAEDSAVLIQDSSEIESIVCYIIDQVAAEKKEFCCRCGGSRSGDSCSEVGVQTQEDPEKRELTEQINDLKDALCQQSLQLLLVNEELLQHQTIVSRKSKLEDDMQALKEVVEQQQALLQKVTTEVESERRRPGAHVTDVAVQTETDERSSVVQWDNMFFEEVLLDHSDSVHSFACRDMTPSPNTSVMISSTPDRGGESKVSDLTSKLRFLFQTK